MPTFLCTLSFLKISVASSRCWFSNIFFAFQASRGKLRIMAIQYPLIRNRMVKKAWTAASGMMYVLRRLQRSMGLI